MNGKDIIDFIKKFKLENVNFSEGENDQEDKKSPINNVPLGQWGDKVECGKGKDELFNRNFGNLHELYQQGKIKLSDDEMDILKFCHGRDMRKFLAEEFAKNPTPKFE